ncbi:MAG: ABC-type transport auxiliary lipoprotein family protein [Candidatus Aquirickettsiella gammari]
MLCLSACSIFEPIKTPPMHYFTLAAKASDWDYCPQHRRHMPTILVNQARPNAVYNSARMIYIPACYQIQYFTQNRWTDPPAQMLQPLLINALQHTDRFQAIINTPSTTYYDWILNTQLLSFQQEFISIPSRFRIAIRAQLINARTRRVISSEDFLVTQIAPHDDAYGGALAANQATQKILNEISCFCLSNLTSLKLNH